MALHFRRRLSFGPLRINVTEHGVSSVAVKLGPVTYNLKSKKTTVDLPGTGPTWTSR